ncbi:MAG: alpha/beta fold hydrolase [Actinomycetota bacterium]
MGTREDLGTADVPPIRFAQARGARLAYQDYGSGPPTIVAVPPLAQNIEVAWEWPATRAMLERFGSFGRWIQFDKRGTGASDRRSRVPGIDERVDDMRAVMDAAEVDRAYIYGASEGGPMALLFAVTYPERVEGIILHGSGARTVERFTPEELKVVLERQRVAASLWGTPDSLVVPRFAPSLVDDAEFRAWHERYERTAADQDSLFELLEVSLTTDVSEVLGEIAVPTLVLHASRDQAVPVACGREAAAGITGAVLVEYDSGDHFGYAGNQSWLDDLERFVTGTVAPQAPAAGSRPGVAVTTLGRFGVTVAGDDVPASAWGSRRARQLCKRLVAARGWPVPRDQLYDLLWPDETDTAKLSARLSVQLSTVRRVLRGGVTATRESVALDLEEVTTDVEQLFSSDDPTSVASIYGGPFLPDDNDESWVPELRSAAHTHAVEAIRAGAEDARTGGRPSDSIDLLRRLLTLDRYDDLAHVALVDTLRLTGDIGAARQAHEARVDAMADLDIEVPPFGES